ncbi:von Willebrand factor type A domain-containing protein [Psychromonas sp. CNPT3]|uniref:VWA domain-containing protein n=1 Tax=Psychromonas sp. CNPT3 TaxID=314282 RepID=UPI0002C0A72D|nr:VWA domain-containing protein [Psychromonas sp. CNPT3]AGH81742.1 von Willebrand factor type A domain-containing protein [Psychromonas sp. CNPT3]
MFEFSHLWLFLILPLPLLARYFLKAASQQHTQVWIPLATGSKQSFLQQTQSKFGAFILLLAWTLVIVALAKPIYYGEPIRAQQQSRNMILSLDLSGSMNEVDMRLDGQSVTRLSLVKSLLKKFVATRQGDRLGLILFADHAYLQTPLTFDLKTIAQRIEETQIGLVGIRTAIGESIAIAIKRFVKNKNKQRILILLTDGSNTAGRIKPLQAARQAAKNHITIYTIGIGADSMLKQGFWGQQRINPSADLDEKSLTEIAKLTGGQYFRAKDQQQLEKIYQIINQLEPIDSEKLKYRPQRDLFYYPLAGALLLLIFYALYLQLQGYRNAR